MVVLDSTTNLAGLSGNAKKEVNAYSWEQLNELLNGSGGGGGGSKVNPFVKTIFLSVLSWTPFIVIML